MRNQDEEKEESVLGMKTSFPFFFFSDLLQQERLQLKKFRRGPLLDCNCNISETKVTLILARTGQTTYTLQAPLAPTRRVILLYPFGATT